MGTARRGDREIHYQVTGKGPAVMLLPGIGSGAKLFGTLPRRFESAGFQCVTMDPVGIPPSSEHHGEFSFEAAAKDVIAIIDDLGYMHCYLVGTSLGGRVALTAAGMSPHRIKRMATLGTTALSTPRGRAVNRYMELLATRVEPDAMAELLAPFLFGRSFFAQKPELIRDIVRAMQPDDSARRLMAAQAEASQAWNGEDIARRLDIPVLCVAGGEDTVIPAADVAATVERLPQGELCEIPNAGHMLLLESPAAFDAVVAFLKRK